MRNLGAADHAHFSAAEILSSAQKQDVIPI